MSTQQLLCMFGHENKQNGNEVEKEKELNKRIEMNVPPPPPLDNEQLGHSLCNSCVVITIIIKK